MENLTELHIIVRTTGWFLSLLSILEMCVLVFSKLPQIVASLSL